VRDRLRIIQLTGRSRWAPLPHSGGHLERRPLCARPAAHLFGPSALTLFAADSIVSPPPLPLCHSPVDEGPAKSTGATRILKSNLERAPLPARPAQSAARVRVVESLSVVALVASFGTSTWGRGLVGPAERVELRRRDKREQLIGDGGTRQDVAKCVGSKRSHNVVESSGTKETIGGQSRCCEPTGPYWPSSMQSRPCESGEFEFQPGAGHSWLAMRKPSH
jgi:hypothetical protein